MSNQTVEIREAIQAAEDTLSHLFQAERCLESASGWGIVDLLGGGFFSTLLKRDKMRGAEQELSEARYAIRRLADELQDIQDVAELRIETDDFLGFADYFFDGVIADWMVQSRISRAKEQVRQAIEKVRRLKKDLEGML